MDSRMKRIACSLGLAAALTLAGTSAFAGILKHPYMIYPGVNSQMEVLWQDNASETTNTLSWGTDTSYSLGSVMVAEYGAFNQHKYTITGLTPNTKYFYQVSDATNGVYGTGSFISGPDDSATSIRFLGMGDSRTNASAMDSVMRAMQNFYQQPGNSEYQRLVIHNGDWVSSDSDTLWTSQWFGPAPVIGSQTNVVLTDQINFTANSPIMGVKGNHDNNSSYPNGNSIYFPKYFPFPYQHTTVGGVPTTFDPAVVQAWANLYYSYDYGPIHFIHIDEYSNMAAGSAQYNWVQSDLAASTKPWKIMIYHEPSYSAGTDGDNSNVRVFEPMLTQYGVDLVYCGHSHNYARTGAYNLAQAGGDTIALNIPHITSGGGGAPVYQPNMTNLTSGGYPHVITAWPAFEFMAFDVSGKDLTMTAYQVNGVSTTAMPSGTPSYTPIETVKLHHYANVSSQISAAASGLSYNRISKLYSGTVTIKNNGPAISGNVDVVLDGIVDLSMIGAADNQYSTLATKQTSKVANNPATNTSSASSALISTVTLTNATGSNNGQPMIRATSNGLASGASVTVPLVFSNPNGVVINFTPVAYQE
jgi:predicted phosphodiesterase